jgi:hypothetical protein
MRITLRKYCFVQNKSTMSIAVKELQMCRGFLLTGGFTSSIGRKGRRN